MMSCMVRLLAFAVLQAVQACRPLPPPPTLPHTHPLGHCHKCLISNIASSLFCPQKNVVAVLKIVEISKKKKKHESLR